MAPARFTPHQGLRGQTAPDLCQEAAALGGQRGQVQGVGTQGVSTSRADVPRYSDREDHYPSKG